MPLECCHGLRLATTHEGTQIPNFEGAVVSSSSEEVLLSPVHKGSACYIGATEKSTGRRRRRTLPSNSPIPCQNVDVAIMGVDTQGHLLRSPDIPNFHGLVDTSAHKDVRLVGAPGNVLNRRLMADAGRLVDNPGATLMPIPHVNILVAVARRKAIPVGHQCKHGVRQDVPLRGWDSGNATEGKVKTRRGTSMSHETYGTTGDHASANPSQGCPSKV